MYFLVEEKFYMWSKRGCKVRGFYGAVGSLWFLVYFLILRVCCCLGRVYVFCIGFVVFGFFEGIVSIGFVQFVLVFFMFSFFLGVLNFYFLWGFKCLEFLEYSLGLQLFRKKLGVLSRGYSTVLYIVWFLVFLGILLRY